MRYIDMVSEGKENFKNLEEKNLIVLNKIGYKKLNKQHYIIFMNVLKKSLVDFKKYLSQLDVEKTFENKGVL